MGPHETFQCQPRNQNFYDSNSFGFDQSQPLQFPVIHQPPQKTSVEILQASENLMKSIQPFLKKFDRISFRETPKVLLLAWDKFFEINHACREKQHQLKDLQELLHKLLKDMQIISEELTYYINTPNWNCPAFYEDDDKEYTIAITPVLPTEEPDNSLSIGNEHLSTIPETESDELIKSSVENLVPIPRSSRIFFDNEKLLSNDSLSLPDTESFHFDHYDVLSSPRPPTKPPDDGILFDFEPDTGVLTSKVVEDISEHYVLMPKLLPTQPILCPYIDTLLPFSSENEDRVFNHGILSSPLFSHQGKITSDFSESPIMISEGNIPLLDVLYLHFYPP
ncbi:hypothetical protein Tco_0471997 [Tanacetum coccineum]